MGSILFFLFLIIAVIFFLGASFISRFIRLFTKGPDAAGRRYTNNRNSRQSNGSPSQDSAENTKVFGKDEGEYVDFEEIK